MTTSGSESLCGIWVDPAGTVHTCVAGPEGAREVRQEVLTPFAWLTVAPPEGAVLPGVTLTRLAGDGAYPVLAHGESGATFQSFLEQARSHGPVDVIRPWESQFLLQRRERLFAGLAFGQLRRCQLDIEVRSRSGDFPDPNQPEDRVLAIGLFCQGRDRTLVLAEDSDAAEKVLLEGLNQVLEEEDPDTIEGHNLFKFDLEFLRVRAKRFKVVCRWGRFGQRATVRNSRFKVAERWIDFPRYDLPGRAVVDTCLLVQQYDVSTREMTSFGLKEVAVHFGVTPEDGVGRTYIEGNAIADVFDQDRARFLAYLADDLRETKGVADVLLPTYFEQARTFPIQLQEATLRGTTGKIDLLFLEHYYHARQACPAPPEVRPFEGGYTRSFQEGVFRHVLHFDVASLYPSLLLHIGRNPRNDSLGVFIPLLKQLREYRLKYKQLARTGETEELRAEANARQASFKILINSFYGYLGFSGARFGDGDLAAEVTRRGRELLQALIDELARQGAKILEADTDGIYLSSPDDYEQPENLLAKAAAILPPGIELEYDGRYVAMFCYKAKNYALYDGKEITIRGSALRSRGIEPYLKRLSDAMIHHLLGAGGESPLELVEHYRREIATGRTPVTELAKTESLSQNPAAYERWAAEGGKPRRAAAEAALLMSPRPRMGDRVTYYIGWRGKGQTSDWQRARPVEQWHPATAPYDPEYYLKRLEDWVERYGTYFGVKPPGGEQGELF
jgi:DNA polymerase, archaea type